jgi:hypothetical protein
VKSSYQLAAAFAWVVRGLPGAVVGVVGLRGRVGRGAGASWVWVCGVVVGLVLAVGVLVLGPAVALAVAPEVPVVSVEVPVRASEVVFGGVLSPGASVGNEGGSYKFLYRASKVGECKGGFETSPGVALGAPDEVLPAEPVSGLVANTEYAVCLSETSLSSETSVSAAVSFKTALPPEAPEVKPASLVVARSATLHGVLNPKAEGNPGSYEFLYRLSGSECQGEGGLASGVEGALGHKAEAAKAAVSGLQPSATYSFCVLARNAAGEEALSGVESFTTLPAAPSVESEAAPAPKATEASLEAHVNPNNEATEYSFEYSTSPVLAGATTVPGSPPAAALEGGEGQAVTVTTTAPLTAETVYYYRAVAENAQSKLEGKPVLGPIQHFTTGPPAKPVTGAAEDVTAGTATLNGVLNPSQEGNPGSYEFVYRPSESECQGEGERTVGGASTGETGEAVSGEVTELLPNATYSFCLLARDEAGETTIGAAVQFTTSPVKPTLEAETTTEVAAASADADAKINPNGSETTYQVQYGTTTSYGTTTTPTKLAAGRTPTAITVVLSGLQENTTYHWRLQATNAAGTTTSVDQTFVYDTTGAGLPDGRQYEQVTPADKNGTLIGNPFIGLQNPQISENGQRVIDTSIGCYENTASCSGARQNDGTPYEFERTSKGWVTHPLAPPASLLESWTVWSVNANTGTALFSGLTPGGNREAFWARQPNGSFTEIGPLAEVGAIGNYQNLTPGFGVLATADLSHVLYEAQVLTFWTFDGHVTELDDLYEYTGGTDKVPLLVGVKGGEGSDELLSTCAINLSVSRAAAKFNGSLSETGRTVYFVAEGRSRPTCAATAVAPPADQLYARVDGESADAHSVLISGPTPASCTTPDCLENTSPGKAVERARDAQFEGASADGERAFFVSAQQLTDNASEDEGENLYLSVCAEPCGRPAEEPDAGERVLVDVSEAADHTKVLGGPRVQGVEAISPDGSHVYFVAQGVLTGGEENELHETAVDGGDNLYVYERDKAHPGGRISFVTRLVVSDEGLNWETEQGDVANVSPDGRFLVFASHRALTVDDTRSEVEGEEAAQVYEYDAVSGVLSRVSVGQEGFDDDGNQGVGDASIVAALTQGVEGGSVPVRSDPSMSANGEFVFFRSPVGLTPGALNDVVVGPKVNPHEKPVGVVYAQNYYEWHDGVVSLISDGKDTTDKSKNSEAGAVDESATNLLGSDVSGGNVFFSSFDELAKSDSDSQLDFYDAHVCSALEPCFPVGLEPVLCGEGACQAAGAGGPGVETPGSLTFSGPGDLAPPVVKVEEEKRKFTRAELLAKALKVCRAKKSLRKRLACEKTARKHYGPVHKAKAKKAGRRRGDTHERGGR